MQFGNSARRALGSLFLAGLLGAWASIGCGGIGPGDYLIYRVASAEGTRTGDCAPEKDGDSSTFRTSSTFVLYAGPDDKLYLDMGEVTLEGTVSDDGYKFSGTSVDVQDLGSSGDTRREETKTSVNVVLDGAAVSGTAVTKVNVDYTCANSGCPDDETCTTTIKFVGSRIDDVALEHDPVN